MFDIYSNARNDELRFTLGKSGTRKLFTIGLNPSTATNEKSDTTVAKVAEVAKRNGFDGFIMLNLYPVRSTEFSALPVEVDEDAFVENLNCIEALISQERNVAIWAAWGENVYARKYFTVAAIELMNRLQKYDITWQHFGSLTSSGHPRHPSRLAYSWEFSKLDTNKYLEKLGLTSSSGKQYA